MLAYRSFLTSSLAACFGLALLAFGTNLPLGTVSRMGPGFIPRAAAIGLLLLAAAIAVRGWMEWRRHRLDEALSAPFHWRGALSIGTAVLTFALLVQPIGLLFSATATVFVSSLAQTGAPLLERVLLASFLAGFSGLVFAVGLGLPISVLPPAL